MGELLKYLRAELDMVERGAYETSAWYSSNEADAYTNGRAKALSDIIELIERWNPPRVGLGDISDDEISRMSSIVA